jgi:hypothetical protein
MEMRERISACSCNSLDPLQSWARMWPLADSGTVPWLQRDGARLSRDGIDVLCCFANGCKGLNNDCDLPHKQIYIAARNTNSTPAAVAVQVRFEPQDVRLVESSEKILLLRGHRPGRTSINPVSHHFDDIKGLESHEGRTVTVDLAVLRGCYSKLDVIERLGTKDWELFNQDVASCFSAAARIQL